MIFNGELIKNFMNEDYYSNDTIMKVLENNNFFVICENIFLNITDTYKQDITSIIIAVCTRLF